LSRERERDSQPSSGYVACHYLEWWRMTIDTLLIDLDATLVDQFDPGSTLQMAYLTIRRFTGLTDPLTTWRAGWASLKAMRHHGTAQTNFEVMVAAFARISGAPIEAVAERFLQLAADDFPGMGWRFRPVSGAREAILLARDLGFTLVLATNPSV